MKSCCMAHYYLVFANETGNVIAQIYAENGDNTKLIQYPCANLIK